MDIEKFLKTDKKLPVAKNVIVNLLYTYGIVNNALNDVLKPYDISIQQFNVLRILRGCKGEPVSLATVQERMINKMSNTTRLIDKLANKGLVIKKVNRNNKRKVDISITNDGLKFLFDIDKLIDSTEEKIIASLTKDEATEAIRLLEKLRSIEN